MEDSDDIEKAKQRINEIYKVRDEIIAATPQLNGIMSNLEWYKKACNQIPEKKSEILSNIKFPLQNVINLNPNDFQRSQVTGATGSFYASSADTRAIIQSCGTVYYELIKEYDEINKVDNLIDQINSLLHPVDDHLSQLLKDAQKTYADWNTKAKTNSDLAKDIRTFQDEFKGFLHKLRIKTYEQPPKHTPDFSWPKMADAIARSGSGFVIGLKKQQTAHDKLHKEFTLIMKKNKEVSFTEMDRLFKDYIEHAISVLNMIDERLMNS